MDMVYKTKSDCCGCGLCAKVCPVNAIAMQEDEYGYVYPVIAEEKCINCNRCRSECRFNKESDLKIPQNTYAAVRKDKNKLMSSSSGGVFAAIAEQFILKGDYVCGAYIDEQFCIKHVLISKEEELNPLLGSKYVQSDILGVYNKIAEVIKEKKVLFCGTPCQVAALKEYTKDADNLYTVEVICHGVPNNRMFQAYIQCIGRDVKKFIFRDKGQGWSFNSKVFKKNGREKKINFRLSSYMAYFMQAITYRESCFNCPYARAERGADITIGDFWGVVKKRKDIAQVVEIDKGVSCLLVNTNKGGDIIDCDELTCFLVDYEDIREGNEPLNSSSVCNDIKKRTMLLEVWRNTGSWEEIDKFWKKQEYKIRYLLWALLPNKIRHVVRVLLKKR